MAEVAGSDAATLRRLVYESDLEHRYETGLSPGNNLSMKLRAPWTENWMWPLC